MSLEIQLEDEQRKIEKILSQSKWLLRIEQDGVEVLGASCVYKYIDGLEFKKSSRAIPAESARQFTIKHNQAKTTIATDEGEKEVCTMNEYYMLWRLENDTYQILRRLT